MGMRYRPLLRQVVVFVLSTVAAFMILVRTNVVSRFAYLVERGKLEAIREAMPSAEEVAALNAPARMVARAVAPGVVMIETFRYSGRSDWETLNRFFGLDREGDADSGGLAVPLDEAHRGVVKPETLRLRTGYGSGFIVEAKLGHIVTNNHVIEDADEIYIYLPDGRKYEAQVLGADAKADLAVLRIDATELHALPLADSSMVEVGDEVMAVGNPFRLDGTFSRGIISAKGRSSIDIQGVEYKGFLQTDAVINPGNSGGPLVNMRGEVVAINTAIATESGHYDGVGFAIPSRRLMRMLPALVRGEKVVRGYLGVSIVSVEDYETLSQSLGWTPYHGVIVRQVLPDTPAERAGLHENDIVIRIGGRRCH